MFQILDLLLLDKPSFYKNQEQGWATFIFFKLMIVANSDREIF